jgi:hypothetical protein
MATIVALGAEKQAASSLALAYPDDTVVFVSDCDILDGADLANVRMVRATPADAAELTRDAERVVLLCPRWLPNAHALSSVLDRLRGTGRCLGFSGELPDSGRWVVKGDRWHRPDAPLSGEARELTHIADDHGCGLIFQPFCQSMGTVMAIGRRGRAGACLIGLVEVLQERFFRNDILQAGETIDDPETLAASLQVLDMLDHRGYFTLNWLRTKEGLKLSSLRPVPRAVFRSFLRADLDLLGEVSELKRAQPGVRFSAYPTYVSYQRLSA